MKIILAFVLLLPQMAWAAEAEYELMVRQVSEYILKNDCRDIPEGKIKVTCENYKQQKISDDALPQAVKNAIVEGNCTGLPPSRRGRREQACRYLLKIGAANRPSPSEEHKPADQIPSAPPPAPAAAKN